MAPARMSETEIRWTSFGRYVGATAALTYGLIVLGGVVRTTGAGDACPDWPLCYGRLIPPLAPLVLLEYAHRLVASIVGLLILGAVVWAYRLPPGRGARTGAWIALGLVALQGLLGGVTVLTGLTAWSVVLHLGTSLFVLASLLVLALRALEPDTRPASSGYRAFVASVLIALYGLVLLGGYVGASGAGLACPDWPLCRGTVLPPPEPGVLPHLAHRVAAVVVLVLLGILVVRTRQERPDLSGLAHGAAVAYGLEIGVGAANKLLRLPPAVVTAHLGLAALVWTLLVVLFTRVSGRSPPGV